MTKDSAVLTRFEHFAIEIGRLCNETDYGKRRGPAGPS